MREHPFHWPLKDELGFYSSIMLATGTPACPEYRRDTFKIYTPGMTALEFLDALHDFHDGHWHVGMEAIGCIGRSRDVSREHDLTAGEHQLNEQ